jgi:MSHA biogenesis protein MshN
VAANDIATVATLANASQLPSLLVLKLSTDFDPDKMVAQPTLVAAENKNAESKLVKPAKTVKENQTAVLAKNNVGSEPSKFIKEISPQQKAEGEYRQATVLQQQGRAAEAIQMLEQALQTDAQHTAALQLLIGLLIESKRQDEAMRWLQQALQADSGQPRLAMILARLQVDRAQVGSAIETLQKSLPQASEQSDYLAFLAALLQREARHKAAVDLYQRALKKNPQNSVWWMGLGISLQAEQRNAEALDAYSRAKAVGGLSNELLAFIEQKISQLAH